ncbi:MAG TPA: rhodanese-like domain-containing protein [Vicinamibacterales bacterium]
MKWLTRLTVNQALALVAFVLGAGAILAQPTNGAAVRIDPQELALVAERGSDLVKPTELADWIIQGRADFRLIDLRDEASFTAYHIPSATNVPLATLPNADLARNEKLILYADDGTRSAQAWFLLRAKGFRGVYMITGGIDGWKQDVLFPVLRDDADPVLAARLRAISTHFGGNVVAAATSVSGAAAPPAVPVVASAAKTVLPPPLPETKAAEVKKPKKKEGC